MNDTYYDMVRRKNLEFLALERARFVHLRDTTDIMDWLPVLNALGADPGNVQSLVLLAQHGPAGRCEAG